MKKDSNQLNLRNVLVNSESKEKKKPSFDLSLRLEERVGPRVKAAARGFPDRHLDRTQCSSALVPGTFAVPAGIVAGGMAAASTTTERGGIGTPDGPRRPENTDHGANGRGSKLTERR